jgi:tetratricopeptide (TPR) repeat protein
MVGTVLSLSVLAADGPDQVAFNAALRSFSIGAYPRAAEEFTAFSSQFPDSALRPEALRRALYAQGEAEAGRGDHAAAQKTFGLYLARFSGSELALHAWVRRAEALFRSSQPQEAAALLDQPEGPFRQALGQGKPADLLFTGLMLAAEAHLGASNWTRAREAVIAATPLAQKPEAQWDRLRLEVRILEVGRQVEPAIAAAEQLRRISGAEGLATRRPESSALLGRLLLAAGQGGRAVASLEENLVPAVPAVFRSDATAISVTGGFLKVSCRWPANVSKGSSPDWETMPPLPHCACAWGKSIFANTWLDGVPIGWAQPPPNPTSASPGPWQNWSGPPL